MKAIIAALTNNRVLGSKGKIPWHSSEEFKHFKSTTMGGTLIMGRKTFESLPGILPGRKTIVVSRSTQSIEGVDVCASINEAFRLAESFGADIFVCGGAEIYTQCLNRVDKLILSFIKQEYEGDAFFPEFDTTQWTVEKEQEFTEFSMKVYTRLPQNQKHHQ